jgi:CelD/BcsL family acetyltransferase involved in cellulose biosynthesis
MTTATKTALTYGNLMTILDVLKAERRVQAHATYSHDQVVKSALKGNPERLQYLVEKQDANYETKLKLDHAFYAVEEMIREYE